MPEQASGQAHSTQSANRPVSDQEASDVGGVLDLGVVLWLVAQHLACAGQRPEGASVVANAIDHQPRDVVLVLDVGSLRRLGEKLSDVVQCFRIRDASRLTPT